MKRKSISQLKKKLDSIFSQYIRLRDSDKQGYCRCYTCKKIAYWKNMQCGHFVSRQYLATRFDEDNCRVQCSGCNVWGRGQLLDFEENLKKELGAKRVEELKQARHKVTKLDQYWYEEKIEYYKSKVNEMSQ